MCDECYCCEPSLSQDELEMQRYYHWVNRHCLGCKNHVYAQYDCCRLSHGPGTCPYVLNNERPPRKTRMYNAEGDSYYLEDYA